MLVIATTQAPRVFTGDEVSLLQALAAEAALALDRARSADALADALQRERLVASIGRKVRSELDLDAVLRVAVEATGSATGVSRCFLRLGEPSKPMPIAAEWTAPGFEPIATVAEHLAVSNLAARDRRTVAVGDIREDPALVDRSLGGTETLLELDTRAVLVTPVLVFDRIIGIFGLHRPEPGEWSVLQCVSHILDAEIVYSGRYRWILAQEEPVMIGYDQDEWVERTHDPTEDPWVMLDVFEGLRLSNVELWKRSSPDQRNRIGRHDERGPETLDLSFRLIAGHDRLHVNQAKLTLATVRKQV